MKRSNAKAGETQRRQGADESEDGGEDSSEQGSGYSDDRGGEADEENRGEDSEESVGAGVEKRPTPVALRTRSRSGSDNGSPRPAKLLNLGPPGCGDGVVQQVTTGQSHQVVGSTTVATLNYLDPRAIYARQVAAMRAAAQEDDAHEQGSAGRQSEHSNEESSGPSTEGVDQEEGTDVNEQAMQDSGSLTATPLVVTARMRVLKKRRRNPATKMKALSILLVHRNSARLSNSDAKGWIWKCRKQTGERAMTSNGTLTFANAQSLK
jgi:hypothetical protein